MMRKYALILISLFIPVFSISEINAVEECITKQGVFITRSRDEIEQFFQARQGNDQEKLQSLKKERKIMSIPQQIPLEITAEEDNGFVNFKIPAFGFAGWALKGDLDCSELVQIPNADYFPLKIGNMWEYKAISLKDGSKKERTLQTIITDKTDNQDGSTAFLVDDKPYVYKYKDAIVAENGIILIKLPLKHRQRWQTKGKGTGQKNVYISDAGFSFELNGISYNDCIRIVSTSEFHALMKENGVEYTAFENKSIYAPDVGLLQADYYRILKDSGERIHYGTKQLISFKTDQPVASKKKVSPSKPKKITVVNSFRFPETGFIHPFISPDEKWLTYFKRDRIWEELYYTDVSKSEKNVVPVFPVDDGVKNDRNRVGGRAWSPDGKMLAVEIEIDYTEYISLVDFSNDVPKLIETVKGERPVFYEKTGALVYLDEFGNIQKKTPGYPPEHAVFIRSSYKVSNEVRDFELANDGTIIYSTGHPQTPNVYLTSLLDSNVKKLLYNGKGVEKVDGVKLSKTYSLSPTGEYALFYLPKKGGSSVQPALLLDLEKYKVVELPVHLKEKAVWSPDGIKLAFLGKPKPSEHVEGSSEKELRRNPSFFIFNAQTGELNNLGIGVFSNYNWTPDSEHIIYSGKLDHETIASVRLGVFLMEINGTELGRLSSLASSSKPVITKSGKYVVWNSWEHSTFFLAENPYQNSMN